MCEKIHFQIYETGVMRKTFLSLQGGHAAVALAWIALLVSLICWVILDVSFHPLSPCFSSMHFYNGQPTYTVRSLM